MPHLCFYFILLLCPLANSQYCSKDSCFPDLSCDKIILKSRKKTTVNLLSIEDDSELWKQPEVPKIFFIESSGRDHLMPRQACALESAIRNSGIDTLVVAMTSKVLYFGENNATCQIFTKFSSNDSGPKVLFRHVDVDAFLKGGPLEKFHLSGQLGSNKDKTVGICNYSDVIRLILISKYGGWYSDLDIVFLKNISSVTDVAASDNYFNQSQKNPDDFGSMLSNAIFHCSANCSFIQTAVDLHSESFSSADWASGGSKLFTKALKTICKESTLPYLNPIEHSKSNCQGFEVLPPNSFFPIKWYEASRLWIDLKTAKDWEEEFQDSYTVHFYQSSWRTDQEIFWPEVYPNDLYPAYVPLAMNHCPLSYFGDDTF